MHKETASKDTALIHTAARSERRIAKLQSAVHVLYGACFFCNLLAVGVYC